jgi:hypothetical protein
MMDESEIFNFLFSASLAESKLIRFPLSGMSMYPTLREEDILIAKPIKYHETRIGDILAYQNLETGKIIVHRLARKIESPGGEMLLTIAEAGRAQGYDAPLRPDNCLIARVVSIERGRKVINLLKSPEILKGRVISYLLEHLPAAITFRKKCHRAIENPAAILKKIARCHC